MQLEIRRAVSSNVIVDETALVLLFGQRIKIALQWDEVVLYKLQGMRWKRVTSDLNFKVEKKCF